MPADPESVLEMVRALRQHEFDGCEFVAIGLCFGRKNFPAGEPLVTIPDVNESDGLRNRDRRH